MPGTIKAPARGLPPWPKPSFADRVTRIELALSAWESDPSTLLGPLTSQDRAPSVPVADPSLPFENRT